MLGGSYLKSSGKSSKKYRWLDAGSLALATTLGSAFFGAVSGSGPATASAVGSIVAQPMLEEGYPKPYISAVIAASAPLGTLIPPSILYGSLWRCYRHFDSQDAQWLGLAWGFYSAVFL